MSRKESSTDYEVGYRRPPKQHQFKKGESGNRKGRPKGQTSVVALLGKALNETVTVQEAGRRKKLRKVEAGAKQFANKVASGDDRALKLLLELGQTPEWKETTYQAVDLSDARARLEKMINGMAEKFKQEDEAAGLGADSSPEPLRPLHNTRSD